MTALVDLCENANFHESKRLKKENDFSQNTQNRYDPEQFGKSE